MKSIALLLCLAAPLQAQTKTVVAVRDFLLDGPDTASLRHSTDSLMSVMRADFAADTALEWITIGFGGKVAPTAGFTLLLHASGANGAITAGWTLENRRLQPTLFWKDCMTVWANEPVRWGHTIARRTLEAIRANAHPEVPRPRPPVPCN